MKSIYEKLERVKSSLGPIIKGMNNDAYGYSYAALPAIFGACNDALLEEHLLIDIEGIIPDVGMTTATNKPYFVWSVSVVDVETGDKLTKPFTFPSDDPIGGRMKTIQAHGSMMTYGQKYIYGAILSIQFEDDPDATHAEKPKPPEITEWLTEEQFNKTLKGTPAQIKTVLEVYNGSKGLGMKKEYRTKLQNELK